MASIVGGYPALKALNISAFDEYLGGLHSRLPRLLDVEQLSPRVIRVLGQNPGKFTLQGTNTYIIGTGAKRLLIDTGQGIPKWADLISETISRGGFSLPHVLLTHWHGDHTGGLPDLLRLYPHLTNSIFKHIPTKGQQPIADGQVFRVEGATLRAVHTPGHAPDHMCFLLEEENALFTGDSLLGHGTAAVENLGPWMAAVRRMQAEGCVKGYPAHGAVILNLKAKLQGELAARVRREQLVLRALNIQSARSSRVRLTVQELSEAVYGDRVDEGVREVALKPFVDEVLRKLAEDGVVGFDMRGGLKRWFAIRSPRLCL